MSLDVEKAREVLVMVVPAQHMDAVLDRLAECVTPDQRLNWLAREMDSNGMWTIQKSVVRRILDLPRGIEVEEPSTAEAKLAAIDALMTEPGPDGVFRWKVGHARRAVRAILRGEP